MKKYKLLKELPGLEAGTIIEFKGDINIEYSISIINKKFTNDNFNFLKRNFEYFLEINFKYLLENNWLEEIKNKSIYELEEGYKYYIISTYGDVIFEKHIDNEIYYSKENLQKLLEIGNVFLTKQEAEKELEKRKALAKIKKWIWENKIELSDSNGFIIISQENDLGIIETIYNYGLNIMFITTKDAKKCLEEYKKEWEILFDLT